MTINIQRFLQTNKLEGDPKLKENLGKIQKRARVKKRCFDLLLLVLSEDIRKKDFMSFRLQLSISRGVELKVANDIFEHMKSEKDILGIFTGGTNFLLSKDELNGLISIIRSNEEIPIEIRKRLVATILFYQTLYGQKVFDCEKGELGEFVSDGKSILDSIGKKKSFKLHEIICPITEKIFFNPWFDTANKCFELEALEDGLKSSDERHEIVMRLVNQERNNPVRDIEEYIKELKPALATKRRARKYVQENLHCVINKEVYFPENIGKACWKLANVGNFDDFKYLLMLGAPINVRNPKHYNDTPLIRAAFIGSPYGKVSKILRISNSILQHRGKYYKSCKNFVEQLMALMPYEVIIVTEKKSKKVRGLTKDEFNILKFAPADIDTLTKSEKKRVIKCIQDVTLDINLSNNNGHTALHCAVIGVSHKLIKLFMEAGANHYKKDNSGYTPSELMRRRERRNASISRSFSEYRRYTGEILSEKTIRETQALLKQCHQRRKIMSYQSMMFLSQKCEFLTAKVAELERKKAAGNSSSQQPSASASTPSPKGKEPM